PSAIALGDSVAVTFAPFDPSGSFERTLTAAQSFVMNLPQQLELWTGGANSAQIANNTITLPTAGAAGGASRVTVYVKAVNIGTGVMTSSSNANFQSYSSPGTTVTMRWAYMGLGSAALDPQTGNATLGFHACGVAMNGRGYCWGDNGEGQLGNGGSTASMVPVPVAGNRLFSLNPQQRSGELGDAHSCGVSSTGVGFCAGRGAEGQLGTGGTGQQTTLVDIPGFTFTYVAGGQGFTCGISATDQTTYCWGRGAPMGATAAPNGSATPQPVIGTRNGDAAGIKFTFVSAGLNSACGITGPGRIYCWGSSGRGQLGNGAQVTGTQLFEVPQQTPVVGVPAVIWRTVRVGAEFACGTALMSTTPVASGLIYCWGRNDFGQLGATANTGPNPRPLLVAPQSAASRFLSLAVGGTHACAVDINQEMWCWGRNNRGQLGNNGVTNSSAMVQVVRGGSGIPAGRVLAIIDAGAEATCAVAAFSQTSFSGEAYCWGASTNGQLGNGVPSGSSYTTPQRVTDPAPPAAGGLSAPRTIAGRLQ
ncbi:MAG TPA: hypothetical protein VKA84_19540, partial [Gemmatimonadaceae bacterium]|nr:hypothetical protein [Gemmatimonadaceae bacterium]